MRRFGPLQTLLLALIFAGMLPACAAPRQCARGGCPGDAQITAEVRARFHQHPALEPPNLIEVETRDHVVYLYGLLDTEFERQLASAVALEAPGVTRVVNSIGLAGSR